MVTIDAEPRTANHIINSTSSSRATVPPFVGREREIQGLHAGLDAILAGCEQVFMLGGEPGIGKTRIAEELVSEARSRGAQVLWGRCYEWEGAPAYWPWVQLIRAYAHVCDTQTLRNQFGTGAVEIAQVVPEIHDLVPDLPAPQAMDPEQSRFRLFDAISTFLRTVARNQPLVIVLDDLHWADKPTLLLLQFVVQEMRDTPLFIVGTYRNSEVDRGHFLNDALAGIMRERGSRRVALQGLSRVDVARFIAHMIDFEPPDSLVEAVFRETEGNPFFVTQVVRLLVAEGLLDAPLRSSPWRIRVPESIREVIGRRLDRLSERCNQVLTLAAMLGRGFNVRILMEVSQIDRLTLLDVLDEAIESHVIQEEGSVGWYRFSHALIQDTLYERMTISRRVRLHRLVGETLESLYAGDLAPHYPELAHHFLQSAPAGDLEKAIAYSASAGDVAMLQLAWEQAVGHYQRALQALELQAAPDQLRRCDLLLALGDAQNRSGSGSGDAPEARETFLEAADVARASDDAERFARAALGYAGFNVVVSFGGIQQVNLLEEALTRLGPADSGLKVRVLSRLAEDLAIISIPPDRERIRVLGDDAVAMARRLGDRVTLAYALAARHFSGWGPDNLADRLVGAGELASIAEGIGDPLAIAWANMIQMETRLEFGDLQGTRQAMDDFDLAGERYRIPYITLRAVVYRAMLYLMAGRFAEAEPLARQGEDLWQSSSLRQHQYQMFELRREQGRLEELRGMFEDSVRVPVSEKNLHAHIAPVYLTVLYLETGREDEGRALFESIAARDFNDVPFDLSWLGIMAMLAEAAFTLADTRRTALLYDLLLPYTRQIVLLGIGAACHGSVSYYLGMLATLLERWSDATNHLEQALEMHERMEMWPYAAHTRFALAEMLRRRNRSGDRDQAIALARQALEAARGMGTTRLEHRVESLLAGLRPAHTGYRLTPRETEVLRQVALGLTDAEISTLLGISTRTVNAHMRSIFSKLEVPSRAAATRVAIEQQLT